MIRYTTIERLWEDSRRLGVLAQLHHQRIDDWSLLKCAKLYAKRQGLIRNIKVVRLLERISDWLRTRLHKAYRLAQERLEKLSQAGKFRLGIWGSAGLSGELLRFYLDLKNARVHRQILVQLYLT
jgi:hypothetical protein